MPETTRIQRRLTRHFASSDQRTLTDRLALYACNVENAYRQLGAIPGRDYTFDVLVDQAIKLMKCELDRGLELTAEDIDPEPISTQSAFEGAIATLCADLDTVRIPDLIKRLAEFEVADRVADDYCEVLLKFGWLRLPGPITANATFVKPAGR